MTTATTAGRPTYDLTNFHKADLSLVLGSEKQSGHAKSWQFVNPHFFKLPLAQINAFYGQLMPKEKDGKKTFEKIPFNEGDKTCKAHIKISLAGRDVDAQMIEWNEKFKSSLKATLGDKYKEDMKVIPLFCQAAKCGFIESYVSVIAMARDKSKNMLNTDFFNCALKNAETGQVHRVPFAAEKVRSLLPNITWDHPLTGEVRLGIKSISVNDNAKTIRVTCSLSMFTMGMYTADYLNKNFPSNAMKLTLEDVLKDELEGAEDMQAISEDQIVAMLQQQTGKPARKEKRPMASDVMAALAAEEGGEPIKKRSKKEALEQQKEKINKQLKTAEMEEKRKQSIIDLKASLAALTKKVAPVTKDITDVRMAELEFAKAHTALFQAEGNEAKAAAMKEYADKAKQVEEAKEAYANNSGPSDDSDDSDDEDLPAVVKRVKNPAATFSEDED